MINGDDIMSDKDKLSVPIDNQSVVQQVINRITEAMISGELRPGDKIPTENEFVETLGVSRNSIREAIKILVYLGVLEIRRAEGTFVRKGFSECMIDPMIYGIILDEDDSYNELKELRELMEKGVMQLAIKSSTAKDMELLEDKYKALQLAIESGNIKDAFEADNKFHETVSEIGHNALVNKINSVVRTLTHDMRLKTVTFMINNNEGDELLKVHKDIYDIIKNKDIDNIEEVVPKSYFYDKQGK